MKKILAIVILLSIGLCANAQRSDGFFASDIYDNNVYRGSAYAYPDTPDLPTFGLHQNQNAYPAPLGTGIFLLTALGAGYAISKRRKEER